MIIHTPPLILLRPQEYYCLQLLQTCSEPERKNDWIQPASRKINLPSRYLQFSPLETTSSTHFETLFSSTQKAEIHSDTPGQLTTNSFHCPLPASETSLSLPRATTGTRTRSRSETQREGQTHQQEHPCSINLEPAIAVHLFLLRVANHISCQNLPLPPSVHDSLAAHALFARQKRRINCRIAHLASRL